MSIRVHPARVWTRLSSMSIHRCNHQDSTPPNKAHGSRLELYVFLFLFLFLLIKVYDPHYCPSGSTRPESGLDSALCQVIGVTIKTQPHRTRLTATAPSFTLPSFTPGSIKASIQHPRGLTQDSHPVPLVRYRECHKTGPLLRNMRPR